MAYFHRDRDHTDPFPLRRVVSSRPLTQDEVEAIYGDAYGASDRRPHELDAGDVSHPRWERAAFPVVASHSVPEAVYPTEYPDDVIELPVRRARWWPVVVLVLAGAIALLVYALGENGIENPASAELDQVELAPLPVDRSTIALGDTWVAVSAAGAVPSEATDGQTEAEAEPAANAAPPRPRAQPAPRRFLPAPPPPKQPAAPVDPYPDLSEDQTLEQLRGLEEEAAPVEPAPPAEAEPAEPAEPAAPEGSWDALPEEMESPPDTIVRDPGF